LGLPDRDYYLDATKEEYCQKYLKHIENVFVLAGESCEQGKQNAEVIFALEKEIAGFSVSKVDLRNTEKIYNPLTLDELKALAPGLCFGEYFAAMEIFNCLFTTQNTSSKPRY
jgi:predicted metalloendopeptidase